jgi:ribosomal protein L12E/L44/L45/RPP1/RPP2
VDEQIAALFQELADMRVGIPPQHLQQMERDLTVRALCDILDEAGVVSTGWLAAKFKELKLKAMKEVVAEAKKQVAVARSEAARATLLKGVR